MKITLRHNQDMQTTFEGNNCPEFFKDDQCEQLNFTRLLAGSVVFKRFCWTVRYLTSCIMNHIFLHPRGSGGFQDHCKKWEN